MFFMCFFRTKVFYYIMIYRLLQILKFLIIFSPHIFRLSFILWREDRMFFIFVWCVILRISLINDSQHSDFFTNTTLPLIFEQERMHNEKIKVILTILFFQWLFKSLSTKLYCQKSYFCYFVWFCHIPLSPQRLMFLLCSDGLCHCLDISAMSLA